MADRYVLANIYVKEKSDVNDFLDKYVSECYETYKKWCYKNDIIKRVDKESFICIVMAAYNLDVKKDKNKLYFT